MKILSAFIRVGFRTIFLVFLLLAAFIFVTANTTLIPGIKSLTLLTDSMEPTVPVGSVVVMKQANAYDVDDVITFKQDDALVTRRIIHITYKPEGTFYTTQADAHDTPDAILINKNDIVGKGIFQITYLGGLQSWLGSVPGFVALIIAPTLIYVGMELWTIKSIIEKETEARVIRQMRANGIFQKKSHIFVVE